eukprot:m.40267 g.40267  ORF g.40267 m.40267 type:complete len:65 (-) comp6913_c1_seq1:1730-1924(-)
MISPPFSCSLFIIIYSSTNSMSFLSLCCQQTTNHIFLFVNPSDKFAIINYHKTQNVTLSQNIWV